MPAFEYTTHSEEETQSLGVLLAQHITPPATVVLTGKLGAGKTVLVKGFVKGLGIGHPDEVTSPTFPLIHEYGTPVRIYHVDLYRLETEAEVATIGMDELFDRDALVMIEWGERFRNLMPAPRVEIEIVVTGETERQVRVRTIQ
ncbi:MAG: tRNA (adenosine(37)-N6)-threonylcarbamoyltransferase complex ATPase subunit type 1 TsaE [Bryobacteraceae bacterium]